MCLGCVLLVCVGLHGLANENRRQQRKHKCLHSCDQQFHCENEDGEY